MKRIRTYDLQVDCPIFSEYKERIKQLTQSINGHKIISKKVDNAQELLDLIDTLSACPKFEEEKEDCENCRFLLHLRKESARVIIYLNSVAT